MPSQYKSQTLILRWIHQIWHLWISSKYFEFINTLTEWLSLFYMGYHVKSNLNVNQSIGLGLFYICFLYLPVTVTKVLSQYNLLFLRTLQNSGAKSNLLRERRVKKKKERELFFSFLYSISIWLYIIYWYIYVILWFLKASIITSLQQEDSYKSSFR